MVRVLYLSLEEVIRCYRENYGGREGSPAAGTAGMGGYRRRVGAGMGGYRRRVRAGTDNYTT